MSLSLFIFVHFSDLLIHSYNNNVSSKVFRDNYKYIGNSRKTSIGDILQLLTIVYNIGHFYNTFTSSKAIVIKASEDERFYDTILNASYSKRYKDVAEEILQRRNYQRLHLLNSILVLERVHIKRASKIIANMITDRKMESSLS